MRVELRYRGMNMPQFKRRLTFADDVRARCLRATLPNSVVPKLAAKHIAKYAEDPEFDVFLRGKDPAKITRWQKQTLERLLEDGELASAIERGVGQYYDKHRDDDYADYERAARKDMKRNGVLPHFVLSDVIIDDARREVILSLGTTADGHIEEHGAVIHRKGARPWRFVDPDHLHEYLSEVEREEAARGKIDFQEDPPDAEPAVPTPSDRADFLDGTWVHDAEADERWMTADGKRASDVRIFLGMFKRTRFEFAGKRMLYWNEYGRSRKPDEVSDIVGIEVQGRRIMIKFREVGQKRVESMAFVYENDRLRNPNGGIYKRKTK